MTLEKLPQFLLIGVPKAGTTTFAAQLGKHPGVFMSPVKEPHFFVADRVKSRVPICIDTEPSYQALFRSALPGQLRGEASVFYFLYGSLAIPRISKLLGNETRIMVLLRNPIERAHSAYRYASALNPDERLSFEDAILKEHRDGPRRGVSPMLNYVACGMYANRLKQWMENFPHMHVMLYDDLKKNGWELFCGSARFLGLDPSKLPAGVDILNVSPGQWKNRTLGRLLKRAALPTVRRSGKRMAPRVYKNIRKTVFHLGMEGADELDPQTKDVLREIYQKDINKTAELLGRDLSHWLE